MEIILVVATLLGGVAAAWYFWDKYRDIAKPNMTPAGASARPKKRAPAKPVVVRTLARAVGVMMGEDDASTRGTLNASRDLVVSTLKRNGALTIETPADAVIAEFNDAESGVTAAAAAREEIAAINLSTALANRVHYRFGIEQGEVEHSPDGPTGAAVESAAALGLRAHEDGINISPAVRQQLPSDTASKIEAAQARTQLLVAGASPGHGTTLPDLIDFSLPDGPSLAVLPFKSIGDDGDGSATLAEGLRLEIQNSLTQIPGLFLLGTSTANGLRAFTAAEVGGRVAVRHALEGTVRRSGEQARVSVVLVDTVSGAIVWSERYDCVLDNTFALQDEITEKIVTALDVQLVSGEQANYVRKNLTDPKAREVYYHGLQCFFRMNAESMASARDSFERVVQFEPNSPSGATWVALCLWFESTRGWSGDADRARESAAEWAERAVTLGDTDGIAQAVLGNVRLLDRRFDEALASAREAVRIRPGCVLANAFLANVLLYCGEPEAAIVHAKHSIRFARVYEPWFVELLAAAYRDAGRIDLAISAGREMTRIGPAAAHGWLVLASALVRIGWLADAKRVVREARALDTALSLAQFTPSQPYREAKVLSRFVDDLRSAGLPDK